MTKGGSYLKKIVKGADLVMSPLLIMDVDSGGLFCYLNSVKLKILHSCDRTLVMCIPINK